MYNHKEEKEKVYAEYNPELIPLLNNVYNIAVKQNDIGVQNLCKKCSKLIATQGYISTNKVNKLIKLAANSYKA